MIDTTRYTQLLVLKRQWPLCVATALTVVAIAVPVALGLPNLYRAATKLSVERQNGMSAAQTSILNGLESRLQLIRNEALSRPYLIEMIDRLNLYPELRRRTSLEDVVNRVQGDIAVNPNSVINGNGGPTTLSFTLSYTGDEPEKAAEVANALAEFYKSQNDKMRSRQASKMADDLAGSLKDARGKSDEAGRKLQEYIRTHASQLPEQATNKNLALTRVMNSLLQTQNQIATLKAAQLNLQTQIAAARSQPTAAVVGSSPEQTLAREKQELQTLLENKAGELNPTVVAKRLRIAQLEDEVRAANAAGKPASPVVATPLDVYTKQFADNEKDLDELTSASNSLDEQRRSLEMEIAKIPSRSPELDNLQREATVARDVYEGYQKQYEPVAIAAGQERNQDSEEFRILDVATTPREPVGPNRVGLILGGVVAAMVLGLVAGIARDQLDTSFHTLDELRGFTQVPVLGSIPKITTNKQRARTATVLLVGTCVLLMSLAFVSYGSYRFAQRHSSITRLVTK